MFSESNGCCRQVRCSDSIGPLLLLRLCQHAVLWFVHEGAASELNGSCHRIAHPAWGRVWSGGAWFQSRLLPVTPPPFLHRSSTSVCAVNTPRCSPTQLAPLQPTDSDPRSEVELHQQAAMIKQHTHSLSHTHNVQSAHASQLITPHIFLRLDDLHAEKHGK